MTQVSVKKFSPSAVKKNVVIFASKGGKFKGGDKDVVKLLGEKEIINRLKGSRFSGGDGEVFDVSSIGSGAVFVVGAGGRNDYEKATWVARGVDLGKALDTAGITDVSIVLDDTGKATVAEAAAAIAEGVFLATYRFDNFKTEQKPHQEAKLKTVTILTFGSLKSAQDAVKEATSVMEGNIFARDLVNLPPNIATPSYMAKEAKKLAKLGLEVEVLDEKKLQKLGMNMMLAVGQGSVDKPCLIMIRHKGGAKKDKTKAFVGKGVMFDTGGYNLKPTGYIETMKCDMAGAAAVMGTMKALALTKAKVNVVGVCGCAMNMIDAEAFLPGAVLESYKGLTVEIGNTDAEGRLVLGDAIAYTIEKEKPSEVINMATLTGACMVALGGGYAGLFSTSKTIETKLKKSADKTGERVWPLPVDDFYAAPPTLADVNNDGSRYGGASTAAVFLKKFADKTPWAHLDIAGVAMEEKVPSQMKLKGASGFGVRLMFDYYTK